MIHYRNPVFCIPSAVLALLGQTLLLVSPALAQEAAQPFHRSQFDVSPLQGIPVPEAFAQPWAPPAPVLSDPNLKLRPAPVSRPVVFAQLPDNPGAEDLAKSRLFPLSPAIFQTGLKSGESLRSLASISKKAASVDSTIRRTVVRSLDEGLAVTRNPHLRFAILADKANREWSSGWFTKALDSWRTAWQIGQGFQDEAEAREVDDVFARLLQATSSLGRADELRKLIAEGGGRATLSGAANEALSDARSILWHLDNRAEQNIFCGFTALNPVCIPRGQKPAFPDVHDETEKAMFIKQGLSLFELLAHSAESGGKVRAYRKSSRDEYATPCVVHLSFGHYSAVTKRDGDRYYLEDTHLKVSGWVGRDALDSQASGVIIVPDGVEVPNTYAPISEEETKQIFGRHCTHGVGDEGCSGDTGGDCPNSGMAGYSFSLLEPGLKIKDTPITHRSPFGPDISFGISYFQRRNGNSEAPIPTNIGNLGPMWSHSFNMFVELRNLTSTPSTEVNVVFPSGQYFKYMNPTGNNYAQRYANRPNLSWLTTGGFKLTYPDGSICLFTKPDSMTPQRYLLEELKDPVGNKLTLSYDGSMRLTSITNDMGQAMTIGYLPESGDNVTGDSFKIRSVTDPFGRVAKFKYTSTGLLFRSIDTINITSEFTYGANDFITQLTTPYGTTKFAAGYLKNSDGQVETDHNPINRLEFTGRYVQATDPLGNVEYAEAFERIDLIPGNDADMLALQALSPSPPAPVADRAVVVPVNGQAVSFLPKNDYLYYRNTYYWSKNAWYHGPRDYEKATIYNYLADGDVITGVLGSMKRPGEGRVWFNYKNQTSASSVPPSTGSSSPAKMVRKVDTAPGQSEWVMQQTDFSGPHSLPKKSIDPLGREMAYDYNGIDLTLVKVRTGPEPTDYTPLTTYSDYTAGHLPQTITDVSGLITTLQYNDRGQVTSVTNQKGGNSETTQYIYRRLDGSTTNEGYLQEIRHTDPANPGQLVTLQTFTYNSAFLVETATGADGYELTYNYDNFGRVTIVTHPDGTTEQSVYDRLNLAASKNRAGEWTRTFYNALRQPVFSQDAAGRVTSYLWCLCGQIRQLIDPRGAVTRWVRDSEGRVLEKIAPDGTKTTMDYYALSGRLKSITRPKDQGTGHPTATFSYTPDGMTAGVDYHDSATPDSSFAYATGGAVDPLGRLLSRTDPVGTTNYLYIPLASGNGAGQLYEENGPLADDTIRRGYDWQDQPNSRQVRSDSGSVLHSESVLTDSLGRITQTVNELGTFTAGYSTGNLTANMNTWSRPNGLSTQFEWYAANEGANALGLKEIHHTHGGATVSKFGYQYDIQGRIQKWTRQLDPSASNKEDWTLGYSRAGELTGLSEANSSGVETDRATWSYDPAGNWYAQGNLTSTTHRTHNSMNRLEKIGGAGRTVVEGTLDEPGSVSVGGEPAVVTSIPGTSNFKFQREIAVQEGGNSFEVAATDAKGNKRVQNYSVTVGAAQKTYHYDASGNLEYEKDPLGNIVRSFEWDSADRLKAVNWGSSQRVEWTYNGLGQKVLETVNGVAKRRFLWDGIALILEKTLDGEITKRFYGDGEKRSGETDAGNYFYTRDHLGSIREVTNQSGVMQARYDYDAYGKRSTVFLVNQTPVGGVSGYLKGCDFGYTGHLTLDSAIPGECQLVLSHFRAYDPQLGRWLSADPLGEAGGTNLYAYCYGNPLNFYDPDGLMVAEPPGFFSWNGTGGDLMENAAQFSMGMADNLSFNLNSKVREAIYGSDYSDRCSNSYNVGEWAGTAVSTLAGGAGGLKVGAKLAGAQGKGLLARLSGSTANATDFSHFIPHRVFKNVTSPFWKKFERSMLNGNIVKTAQHILHDKTLATSNLIGRNADEVMSLPLRILSRFPRAIAGTGIGAAAGAGVGLISQAGNGGDCP